MREPISSTLDARCSDDESGLKPWQAPSLLRLDAESAENNVSPGVDGIGSAS